MQQDLQKSVEQLKSMFQDLETDLIYEILINFEGDLEQTCEALIKISEESLQKSALDSQDDYNRNSNLRNPDPIAEQEEEEEEDHLDTSYNHKIAEMMQAQFDLEYEEKLQQAIEESMQDRHRMKNMLIKKKGLKEVQASIPDFIEKIPKESIDDDEEVISFEYPNSNSYSRGAFIPKNKEEEMILKY